MWARRAGAIARHVRPLPCAALAEPQGDEEAELAASTAEFREHGVAPIPGLVGASALEAIRAALQAERASSAAPEASGEAGWRSPGFFDAPGLLESDGACLAVLENPRLAGLVQAAVGADAHLVNLQAALGSPAPHSAMQWRRDYGRDDGVGGLQQASFLHPVLSEGVKIFLALADQEEAGVAFVPDTFRRAEPPPDAPAGQKRWKARAGDALLMDVKTHHATLADAVEGDCLVLYFQAFNKKPMAGVAAAAARLDASAQLSPLRRQLLGLHDDGFAGNHMRGTNEPITFAPAPPQPPPTSAASTIPRLQPGHNDAPQSLEEQVQHMRDWGFVRLKRFVAPQTLARLQTEFRKEQAAVLQAQDGPPPSMFDLPFGSGKVLEGEMGGPLMEIIESLSPLASRVVGKDAQIINIQPRTVPSTAAPGEEPKGYTSWHRVSAVASRAALGDAVSLILAD